MAEFEVGPRRTNRWALWVFVVIVTMTFLFFFIRNYKSGSIPSLFSPDSATIDQKK